MEVAFDAAGMGTTLRDGDLLRVLSIVPRYQKTVTLRGNTANPGHFAWHEGMKLSDLIPDRDALMTRDYYWRRAQLGLPTPEFQPYVAGPVQFQPSNSIDLQSQQAYQQWQLQNRVQRLPNGQYVFVNPQGTEGQTATSQINQQKSVVNQYPYAQGNVYLQGEQQYTVLPSANGQQQPTTDMSGTSASAASTQQQLPGSDFVGKGGLNPSQLASNGSLAGKAGSGDHKTPKPPSERMM